MEIRELKFLTFSQGSAQPERGARPEHGEGRGGRPGLARVRVGRSQPYLNTRSLTGRAVT